MRHTLKRFEPFDYEKLHLQHMTRVKVTYGPSKVTYESSPFHSWPGSLWVKYRVTLDCNDIVYNLYDIKAR